MNLKYKENVYENEKKGYITSTVQNLRKRIKIKNCKKRINLYQNCMIYFLVLLNISLLFYIMKHILVE